MFGLCRGPNHSLCCLLPCIRGERGEQTDSFCHVVIEVQWELEVQQRAMVHEKRVGVQRG